MLIKEKRGNFVPFRFKYMGSGARTVGLYVFVEFVQRLKSLFQKNITKTSFREIAWFVARKLKSTFYGFKGSFITYLRVTASVIQNVLAVINGSQ